MRQFEMILVLWTGLLGVGSLAHAGGGFNPETVIAESGTSPALIVGVGNTVVLAYEVAGDVSITFSPDGDGDSFVVAGSGNTAEPAVHLSPAGVTTVVFQVADPTPGAQGDEVFYSTNLSGPFQMATNLSSSLLGDSLPSITGGGLVSSSQIAWIREDGGLSDVMVSSDLGAPVAVASGSKAALVSQNDGTSHLVYIRDGDAYYRPGAAGGFGAEQLVNAGADASSDPALALDQFSTLHVVFASGGDIWYSNRGASASTFSTPVNVTQSAGDSHDGSVLAGPGGLTFLYVEGGDIRRIRATGTIFLASENLTDTPFLFESDPSAAIDSNGYLHLSYVNNVGVIYRNDAPLPTADFVHTPFAGEAPLEVEFSNLSTGVIDSYLWDFGDGATSGLIDPDHIYTISGTYTVSLTVAGPGGQDTMVQESTVQVIDSSNFMSVQSVKVFQNQSDVYVPILGSNSAPIQGFQVSVQWDCAVLEVGELTLNATNTLALLPEFFVADLDPSCYGILGVIFDISAPFDGRTLAPLAGQRLANLVAHIPSDAPLGLSSVDLVQGLSTPPIFNIFTVNGISVLPVLSNGQVEVIPFAFPLPPLFVRGDYDNSATVEITDVINLLSFLFSGGSEPNCPDAADANDSGEIDVSDAVFLLDFLFSGGAFPAPPYPNFGLDPTEDGLTGC